MSHFGKKIPNLAKCFGLKFRKQIYEKKLVAVSV